jgi:hypothetical protein
MGFADVGGMLNRKQALTGFAALALTLLTARAASADVCVAVDTTRDTLSEQDRNSTRILLGQALRQQGIAVADQNCMGTYVVYHVRLGNSITVFLQGPQGYREAQARAIEEIPAVYSQMIRSLVTGQPMTTHGNTVDRSNVTATQQAPNRVQADSLWYFRLGYGGATGPVTNAGPGFGFGYRYELDALAIDLSFLNLLVFGNDDPNSSEAGVTGSWVKLMGLYFFNPTGNGSLYLGAGVGYGVTAVGDNANTYTGTGLQGEVALGFEFLRASTIRIFAELDATLPFYGVYQTVLSGTPGDKSYVPSFVASLGIGWGRGGLVRVHMVP